MPFVKVETNVELDAAKQQELVAGLSGLAASLTGKPERWVMARVDAGVALAYSGTMDPAAYVEFKSIGLAEDACAALSAGVCAFLLKQLNIPGDRIYLEFKDLERSMFGYDGKTF